eukprot:6375092-Prymnesium_polylepis.3
MPETAGWSLFRAVAAGGPHAVCQHARGNKDIGMLASCPCGVHLDGFCSRRIGCLRNDFRLHVYVRDLACAWRANRVEHGLTNGPRTSGKTRLGDSLCLNRSCARQSTPLRRPTTGHHRQQRLPREC